MNKNTKLIESAIQVLKHDGIIGFPTDTVYGIGCDAYNQIAIDRIYKLKQRSLDKPLILFISDKSKLKKYVPKVTITATRLVEKFWPGGLTIIFNAKRNVPIPTSDYTVGIRIPDNEFVLNLLRQYNKPLATTSANIEGTTPPTDHLEMNIEPDFVIQGRCKWGLPSTIIDVSRGLINQTPTLLRKGKVGILELESVTKRYIKLGKGVNFCVLFVCSANRCRSPMAMGILKKLLPSVEVDACGIHGTYGELPTESTIQVMKEIEVDISSYYSKPISQSLINWADLILTADEAQKDEVISLFPEAKFKTRVIAPGGIKDPIGGTIETYLETREQLIKSITAWVEKLKKRIE
ncbi:MAG: L-threonylcarbamoyladenylate synthase [bacterium]|nr:L-threonylcarbamoyladenylate synthase [bacterium]